MLHLLYKKNVETFTLKLTNLLHLGAAYCSRLGTLVPLNTLHNNIQNILANELKRELSFTVLLLDSVT